MNGYDFFVLGTGNPIHPENQKEQQRTFEDIVSELFADDKEIIWDYVNNLLPKKNKENSGFKIRCEMALDKLNELEQYAIVCDNTYLKSRLKSIIKIIKT